MKWYKHIFCSNRIDSLLSQRFGYGAMVNGGADGVMTKINSLSDDSLYLALTDEIPRWIYFNSALDGQVWSVPDGSHKLGKYKTLDGRDARITFQYGIPNFDTDISLGNEGNVGQVGQLVGVSGELIMVGITHVGDLGWPYEYKKPYFKNGLTDGLEIWGGENYWIHQNTWSRMSDESLSVFHFEGGSPDNVTFSFNRFHETKTASLIGARGNQQPARVTIAFNFYDEMVNGRAPGEFRNVHAHVFYNVIQYVNDEGIRVGESGKVVSERNIFDLGCSPAVSGARAMRYVLPNEVPLGELVSLNDWVSEDAQLCSVTLDEGFSINAADIAFDIPNSPAYHNYKVDANSKESLRAFIGKNAGAESALTDGLCIN